jgi:hypothetical protein
VKTERRSNQQINKQEKERRDDVREEQAEDGRRNEMIGERDRKFQQRTREAWSERSLERNRLTSLRISR